jgi:hypothetical protein
MTSYKRLTSRPGLEEIAMAQFSVLELELISALLYDVVLGGPDGSYSNAAYNALSKIEAFADSVWDDKDFCATASKNVHVKINGLDGSGNRGLVIPEGFFEIKVN